ncbi:endonuclease/exonuclease/phosphatase family protein [Actinophytocola sp.]|uniref:endonuclease/exonuclease/phosphatase family protein n=1 Tax=Actinophytocola sp. TaxID=1872138 RepID=UPI002D7F6C3A|nr:endonuclease/exonuclease/phosphatase family protein [Actinophytocola sp.]HET9139663.1 endonuclease/exonuclease/phosphatase family protein [Actinophytocola sp.]
MLRKPAEPKPPPRPAVPPRPARPRVGGRRTTALLWLFGLVFIGIAVLRVLGVDGPPVLVSALALTPYLVLAGLLLFLIAFAVRRRVLAFAVLLMTLSIAVLLVPRMVGDSQPEARGDHLRVLSASLNAGRVDPAAVVRLVREQRVDVLTLPELTEEALAGLDAAGLATELPNRVLDTLPGGNGSGIAARFPLRKIVLVEPDVRAQTSAVVDLPGQADVEVLAVHVVPISEGDADRWRAELGALPKPFPERVRVLAGDFAATFDHAAFRRILDPGFVDAAEQAGKGLLPTWVSAPFGPPATRDHILADQRCAISDYAVHDLPGGDHEAVLSEIVLP